MKKTVSILLALILTFSLAAMPCAFAADVKTLAEPNSTDSDVIQGAELKTWDYIDIGKYAHMLPDGVTHETEATDVLWQVVSVNREEGSARLVSKYVLDQKVLDENVTGENWVSAIYDSTLAAWLNGNFKDSAFTSEEQSVLMYYNAPFYSTGPNKEGSYSGNRLATEGTQVSFVDFYNDCYFAPVSQPLGTGSSVYDAMLATYKGGADSVDYWTGTSGSWHGNVMISNNTDVPFYIRDHGGDAGAGYRVYAEDAGGVRPMIKIDLNELTLTGSGTMENPYAIDSVVIQGTELKPWGYINIGQYDHILDNNGTYEGAATDVLWQVVDVNEDEGSARLVSKYVLDRKAMDPSAVDAPCSSIYSPLADWLNGNFKANVFSAEEQGILLDYDSYLYTLAKGSTDDATYAARKPDPGIKVMFPDLYTDYYFSSATKPLGIGSDGSIAPMLATYKNGAPADYWTGTSRDYTACIPPLYNTRILEDGTDNPAAGEVSGVRPMIKVDLKGFKVTGTGSIDDPYKIASYIAQEVEPVPEEWTDCSPSAELNGKTLTLSFGNAVEIPQANTFTKRSFTVRQGSLTTQVTTANLLGGILILQLADYLSSSGGAVTLSYSKPNNNYIFKQGTIEYVPSLSDVAVVNNNGDAPPIQNKPGFSVQNIQSMKESAGAVLDPSYPAWGGHQSRIVRTENGVYLAFLVQPDVTDTRKFQVYKIDEPSPVLIGEETINGVAISFLADRDGNLYVSCLTRMNPDDVGYGRPTAFKYTGGQPGPKKIQAGITLNDKGNDMWNTGNWNYEGVSIDADGNFRYVIPYVDNSGINRSRLVWLTLDTALDQWSAPQQSVTNWAELYVYVLPKSDGSTGVVTNLSGSYGNFGYTPPPGYGPGNYLWYNITLWNIPDMGSGNIDEIQRYKLDYSTDEPQPTVQNASGGDSYVDSKGYTHLLINFNSTIGLNTSPMEIRYVILDENNHVILDRKLFDGFQSCRFAETPNGDLYILKMTSGASTLEVYAVNDNHTDLTSEAPVFVQSITNANGTQYNSTYSGISVTSPRAGNTREYFVDVAFPVLLSGSSVAADWVTFRLQLPANAILITDVTNGNGQSDVNYAIRSANGKGYSVYISDSGAEGPFKLYTDVNFNSKGAHIRGLQNGQTYYAYIVYNDGKIIEKSGVVKLEPHK